MSVKNRALRMRVWLSNYKTERGCSCGEKHPAVLQFHHRDPNEKEIDISKALFNGWSQKRLLSEIEKCDVKCANCHLKLHWKGLPNEAPQRRPRRPPAEKCKVCGSTELVPKRAFCKVHWNEHQKQIMSQRRKQGLAPTWGKIGD